jgi:hypothetical protein
VVWASDYIQLVRVSLHTNQQPKVSAEVCVGLVEPHVFEPEVWQWAELCGSVLNQLYHILRSLENQEVQRGQDVHRTLYEAAGDLGGG